MSGPFLHYCSDPTCGAKTTERYCPAHAVAQRQAYDQDRGSRHDRGYGRKWDRYRARFKAEYPLCGDRPPDAPLTPDSVCRAQGRRTPMYVVDHIRPVTGADDPTFYDPSNQQALCERCHNAKRRRERG